jgi:L-2-hydroxyglutarate oxidase
VTKPVDVVVIGGGIVGMATAVALIEMGRGPVIVLEAEKVLGEHQTGRNSGVIHSGIYYKPASLKAKLCAEGREAMFRFCKEREIAHERCGKVIVATRAELVPMLDVLEERGRQNGLAPRRITAEEVREREPHVACLAGLDVGETGIVKFSTVLRALGDVVAEKGGEVRTGSRVVSIRREGGEHGDFVVETRGEGSTGAEVVARNLVNCAGLQCDRIARLAGAEPGLRIIPFRGEYYDLVEAKRGLCKNLIYPVPDPRFPFLGVHLTRAVDGTVEAGPNAVLAMKREGYFKSSFSLGDVGSLLGYGGFWRMAMKHGRTGLFEMYRSLVKSAFVRAVQELVPEIRSEDLEAGRAGVRAQAVEPTGALVDDFRIVEGRGMLHVLNAPSPAATASLAIGKYIATAARRVFREV